MQKPFDLQAALAGKPVLGPDGRLVRRLIHTPEVNDEDAKVLAILHDGSLVWRNEQGRAYGCPPLTMADPPKRKVEGWVNVYKCGSYYTSGWVYDSKAAADAACGVDNIKLRTVVIPISFEVEDEA